MDEIAFAPFDAAEFAEWYDRSAATYVEERVAAGDSVDEARTNADQSMQRIFPGRVPNPHQHTGRLVVAGSAVGELWVGPFDDDPARWWVWDIKIDEEYRGRGLGRAAMLLAERLATAEGARTIGLNVFAHNRVARGLYTSLGYAESSVQMRKDLASPG
jgi:ribosomal protein S18 acetylase RimI-like enzyme